MNKIICKILAISLIICSLTSCKELKNRTVFLMDTVITIETESDEIIEKVITSVKEVDAALNFHNEQSDLSKFNLMRSTRNTPILSDCLTKAYDYSVKTNGAFNMNLGQITSIYDFNEQIAPTDDYTYSLLPTTTPENLVFFSEEIRVINGALVDLGGIAKGYALEKAINLLKAENVKEAYLNFGGSIYYLSNKEQTIGRRKMLQINQVKIQVSLKLRALLNL